jgi:nucleoside-diphosphate-sugar epimerase
MEFIVTGASGFVGRGLLAHLAERGHGGIATGRRPPVGLPPGWRPAARDDVLAGRVGPTGPAVVVHLEVRQHLPRPTAADIDVLRQVNIEGTRAWLDWAARQGVRRFVHLSSIKAAAPDRAERVVEASAASLRGPAGMSDSYGWSKAVAESLVRDWALAADAREAVILRPAPVYGPGSGSNLGAFARHVVSGRPCLIGACDARKSVVSRRNLAAAIECAAALPASDCPVYNVSDRETHTLGDLAGMISQLAGGPAPRRISKPLARLLAIFGDLSTAVTGREFPLTSQRLRVMLESTEFPCDRLVAAGFSHPQSTREGLAEMVAWMASGEPVDRPADRLDAGLRTA